MDCVIEIGDSKNNSSSLQNIESGNSVDDEQKIDNEQKIAMIPQPTYIKRLNMQHKKDDSPTIMDYKNNMIIGDETTMLKTPYEPAVSTETIHTESSTSSFHDESHEFSISTLDRKLREIKRLKKRNKKKLSKKSPFSSKKKSKHISRPVHVLSPLGSDNRYLEPSNQKTDADIFKIDSNQLINEHLKEIQLRIVGHTRAALSYEKKDKIIGYPVTILSSFLTSSIMLTLTSGKDAKRDNIKYISLTLSIMSFLFSVSRDYLNYSKKFQSHDLSSKLYTTLFRTIEVRLINETSKQETRSIFHDIVNQMSIIEQYETPIPEKIDRTIRESINDILMV